MTDHISDPLERWAVTSDGRRRYKRGHCGVVYQACGFDYLGRATPRTLDFLPDGTLLSARAAAKVTGGERGHRGVIARLVALGAPPPVASQKPSEWLCQAKHAIGVRAQRHPGNHRFWRQFDRVAVGSRNGIRTPDGLRHAAESTAGDTSRVSWYRSLRNNGTRR